MNIFFDDIIRTAAPQLRVVAIEARVTNRPTSEAMRSLLADESARIAATYAMAEINKRPAIAATRQAYKALGKEPNRYRPSSEALCRRAVKGMELYYISELVDLINVLSMASGYSIGGFDADKIAGDTLRLGAGMADEPFEGIGRGPLNIEHMPVYRDAIGGIGTPTSDNERTKIDTSTTSLLMTINVYGEEMPIDRTIEMATRLLTDYCSATDISAKLHLCTGA